MNWTGRVTGTWVALVAQAVVFGLAHGGADVGGSPIVLMTVLGIGGFIAGWIALADAVAAHPDRLARRARPAALRLPRLPRLVDVRGPFPGPRAAPVPSSAS